MHLFRSLPRRPFKRGKSLEEPGLPPPEGAPRLVPETQREPREKNGEARWLRPEESGPFPQAPRKRDGRARLVPENFPEGRESSSWPHHLKIRAVKTLSPNLTWPCKVK